MNVELESIFPEVELEVEATGGSVAAVAIQNVSMAIHQTPVRLWGTWLHLLFAVSVVIIYTRFIRAERGFGIPSRLDAGNMVFSRKPWQLTQVVSCPTVCHPQLAFAILWLVMALSQPHRAHGCVGRNKSQRRTSVPKQVGLKLMPNWASGISGATCRHLASAGVRCVWVL
jgi:hypothetical protein